ncbi:MAG: nucleotide exchange factor GrpE [Parcubacteria group bacterium]|nr:nucleotide exchange factor GrpE [Parcubacteria group bacterium]
MSEILDKDNEKKSDDKGSELRGQRSEPSPQEDQTGKLKELTEQLKVCEAKTEEYLNGWKRAQADYQNLTRRMAQHEAELIQFATEELAKELLSVIDSFDRALKVLTDEEKASSIGKGFIAICEQLTNLLKTHDVARIETVGKPLDPKAHYAVAEESRDGVASGVIVEEVSAGYRMGEKVIRPAKVKIAR